MPSLQALGEFKSSFNNIGGELRILDELDLPFDDLSLPDHEPEAAQPSAEAPAQDQPAAPSEPAEAQGDAPGTDFNLGDMGDLLGGMDNSVTTPPAEAPEEPPPDAQGAEFSDFIDGIPDDPGQKDGADEDSTSGAPETPPDAVASDTGADADASENTGLPPDLLDGLADELETAREENGKKDSDDLDLSDLDFSGQSPGGEDSSQDSIDLDSKETPDLPAGPAGGSDLPDQKPEDGLDLSDGGLDDLPDFDSVESPELPEETGEGDLEDLDLPIQDSIDLDSGETLDLSTEKHEGGVGLPAQEPADGAALPDGDLADLPDFDSVESPELPEETGEAKPGETDVSEPAAADDGVMDLSGDDDNLDLGGENQEFESEAAFDTDAVLEEIPGDSFDNFSLDSAALSGESGSDESDSGGLGDDFALSGIDLDGKPAPKKATSLKSTGKQAAQGKSGEVDEISLSEEELDMFQRTLSSYPLNLRIACEEIIAEQVIAPEQLSNLVDLLIDGASASDTAALAGKILKRNIPIPKGFEKKTGEALEAEQASFAYIFVHNFLPVLRLFMMIALVILSAGYLSWKFIYNPIKAEKIYKLGIERIDAGEYGRANERFREAFKIHEKKIWFYKYARAFREARQYTFAEEKYQELLYYTASKNKKHIPEKQAVLEYADLETNAIGDYQTADSILRRNILDYDPFDYDALLALGDNNLVWGEYESDRLELARESFATLMERYGRSDPLLERMLKYFIRTDNLGEVIPLQDYFMASVKRKISAETLAEMGGYLLDKRFEKVHGVPNEYLNSIGGIRDILFRAIRQDSMLPESYYHLARYYNYYEDKNEEKVTLDLAVRVFEAVKEETPKRIRYHINTLRRYAEVLISQREFFPAEEHLVKGVKLYQDGLSRRLLTRAPEFGRLYADLGDLEYFVKDGDMQTALDYYQLGEQSGWAPPEIIYRIGAAHYQLRQWGPALERFFAAYRETPPNRRILYALGNVSYMRGNYFAAQGYYDKLLEILETDRSRLPPITPTNDEKQLDLAERLMVAQNNLGVTLETLTENTGRSRYRSRAQGLFADSERAWDVLTRNPVTMIRMRPSPEIAAPGINPAYLNVQNSLHPAPGYEPQFFLRIDKDILEPSEWEDLAPPGYRLSEGIYTGR